MPAPCHAPAPVGAASRRPPVAEPSRLPRLTRPPHLRAFRALRGLFTRSALPLFPSALLPPVAACIKNQPQPHPMRPVRLPAPVSRPPALRPLPPSVALLRAIRHAPASFPRTPQRRSPTFAWRLPTFGWSLPTSGTRLPSFGTRLPIAGTRLPNVGTHLPTVGRRLPTVRTRLPAVGTRLPAVGTRLPAVGTRLPTVGTRLPTVRTRLPAFGTRLPSVGTRPISPETGLSRATPSLPPPQTKPTKPTRYGQN